MSRIEKKFLDLAGQGRKALIPYLTAGDPDLETTEKLLLALDHAGADIIELGMPFSDPMADGPTIQEASERALRNYFSADDVFALVERFRSRSDVPVLLFGYYNPIFKYGEERFCSMAQEVGVDGLLVVDLPPEEGSSLQAHCGDTGLDLIYLIAPTTPDERIRRVVAQGSGFIYYVAVTGVTGARTTLSDTIAQDVPRIKAATELPVAVGFGISSSEQAQEVAKHADAVVVGSAIVKIIGENGRSPDLIEKVTAFVKSLRQGVDKV